MKRKLELHPETVPPPSVTRVFQMIVSEFVPDDLPTINDKLLMLEESWWYYIDVYRLLYPELPPSEFSDFVIKAASLVPCLFPMKPALGPNTLERTLSEFNAYKSNIPCYGAILLDETLEYILLVQGFGTNKWGLPKGKMKIKEAPMVCAVREVEEEIGLNIQQYMIEECVETKLGKKDVTYFFAPYVPIQSMLQPNSRMEINVIAWHEIQTVKQEVLRKNQEFNFINGNILKEILRFVAKKKNTHFDENEIQVTPNNQVVNDLSFGLMYFLKLYSTAFKSECLHR
ncbi:hypothetical protein EIN_020540 [Entamoeba invadens IP1]|uniref:hypothetical protein n=1 Tax=Entamoeba invadens IP1 TaxID=370355 RepID=UPI0002C3DB8E|nr:hypothetical protein EIN_020540 [Entamoeba invadens IP1]ELP90585.1 hypothetical protein EIN_020540 [Entamoeba invadens IP1]|eukprot:XP_004257356.1 hypothetical protein EIN_020540 [Entamoeba invadens IP1]